MHIGWRIRRHAIGTQTQPYSFISAMTSNAQKVTMNLKNLSYFLILVLSVSCGSGDYPST
jgi:hypothetical protein